MLESWEQTQIDRLEHRVCQLERKSWERSDFNFRLIVHGFTAAMIVLAIAAVVLGASHPSH